MMVHNTPGCDDAQLPARFCSAEILAVLAHVGAREAGCLLDGSGVTMADLVDSGHRIGIADADRVLANARRMGGPSIDIEVGRRLNAQAFGVAGVALLTCSSIMAAVELLQRFWPLFNLRFDPTVRHDTSGTLSLDMRERLELGSEASASNFRLEMVKLVTLLRDLAGAPLAVVAATVTGDAADHADLAACLGVPLRSAARPSITICATAMAPFASPSTAARDAAHRASVKQCERIMADMFVEPELIRTVRAKLGLLQDGAPAPRAVAASLGMSERTLRRRLQALGNSYNRILGEVRRDLAERLLDDNSMTTELIAERLGYTEATNFRHAFRRWTGSSPQRYRAAIARSAVPHLSSEMEAVIMRVTA